jgi:XTP/dITP diphosphohydrolase
MALRAIVAATSNPGKLQEFRTLLTGLPLRVASLEGRGPIRFPEEGSDYAANAIAKADAVADQLGQWALADDSGLEVDALEGGPGAFSARFGGARLDDAGRVAHLLRALEGHPPAQWTARFVCVVALVRPGAERLVARGECSGRIVVQPCGGGGFGYDPVFRPDGFEQTMAQLAPRQKDLISHRGRAFAQLRATLSAEAAF